MERMGLFAVPANEDQVISLCPIPPGGRLLQVQGSVHVMPSAAIAIDEIVVYALHGYVLPVLDPDLADNVDDIWDNLVPKGQSIGSAGVIDLDQVAEDVEPVWEPGLENPEQMLNIDVMNIAEFYSRQRVMTYASHPMLAHLDTTLKYLPAEVARVKVNRSYSVRQPSMAMLGFSSPQTGSTTTSLQTAPSEKEWGLMFFLKNTVLQMVTHALGTIEAGAESPYVEAALFLARLVVADVIEESAVAAHLMPVTYNVYTRLAFKVDMPDRLVGHELSG